MAHFAKVENNIVTEVIVAESQEWCDTNLTGTWIQTSYNTYGGEHSQGGTPLHKNYAGIGYTWDGVGFARPKPFPSWTFNEETYLWESPTPYPTTEGKTYYWSEDDLTWREITND
jgi:hypothetical protein